jgi:hypothetical protein
LPSAPPLLNLNKALMESLGCTGVLMDSSVSVGLPELFLLQLRMIDVINNADMTGNRKEPGFMLLI